MPVVADETNLTADVDAILAKVTPKTKIVFLANPNNPTGTYLPVQRGRAPRRRLCRRMSCSILDAAYAEYRDAQRLRRRDSNSPARAKNVVMTRTFSKIYGLAGAAARLVLRAAGDHAMRINRLRGPFNIKTPAMRAGIAAIEDQDHVDKVHRA